MLNKLFKGGVVDFVLDNDFEILAGRTTLSIGEIFAEVFGPLR